MQGLRSNPLEIRLLFKNFQSRSLQVYLFKIFDRNRTLYASSILIDLLFSHDESLLSIPVDYTVMNDNKFIVSA